jgi:hypothetical protein
VFGFYSSLTLQNGLARLCRSTVIHIWRPKDGVAKELDFVRELSADPSPYHKRKPLQDLEKTAMKHSRSGTSEHSLKSFFTSDLQWKYLLVTVSLSLSLFVSFLAQFSLFSAASKSIQIKCLSDDEDENENSTVRSSIVVSCL